MALNTGLKKFFNQDVTIAPWSSAGTYNEPTYGTAVSYKAKIENRRTMIRTDFGMEEKSTRKIFLFTETTTFTTKDQITLPAAFAPTTPKILSVRIVTDIPGISHVVIETE